MNKHWQYLKYVVRHKWFVLGAGRKLGVPLHRLILHDWTKFLPREWFPYVNEFYGDRMVKPKTGYMHVLTPEDIQFGIRIGNKDYWGKGYGTEVVELLVDYWHYNLGIKRLWLKVLPTNLRAIRCYEKCGFEQAGRLLLDGYDFVVMEIKL